MTMRLLYLISFFLVFGCSTINEDLDISSISFESQGKNNDIRSEMTSICKGFILTQQQVTDFYFHATRIDDKSLTERFMLLPCYSSGTAYLYGKKYKWVIRSGGIARFYNNHDEFFKLCGKKCCLQVEGIC